MTAKLQSWFCVGAGDGWKGARGWMEESARPACSSAPSLPGDGDGDGEGTGTAAGPSPGLFRPVHLPAFQALEAPARQLLEHHPGRPEASCPVCRVWAELRPPAASSTHVTPVGAWAPGPRGGPAFREGPLMRVVKVSEVCGWALTPRDWCPP